MQETRQQIRGLIEAMKEQGDVIFGEILPLLNELETLRAQSAQAGQYEAAQHALEAAQAKVQSLEAALMPLQSEADELRGQVAALRRQLTDAQARLAEAEARPAPAAAAPSGGIDPAALAELQYQVEVMDHANAQTDIIKAVLDGASRFAPRAALCIIKGAQAQVWSGHGFEADIRNRTIPLGTGNAFARAIQKLKFEHGLGADEPAVHQLSPATPGHWVIVPLVLRGRANAVLYVDDGGQGRSIPVAPLVLLCRAASLALEGQKDRDKRLPAAPERVLTVVGGGAAAEPVLDAGEPLLDVEMTPAVESAPEPVYAPPPPPPPPVVTAPPPPPPPPAPAMAPPPPPPPVAVAPPPPPPPPPPPLPPVAAAPPPPALRLTPPPTAAAAPVAAPAASDIPPEEKRLHDDARRYARVLAQEILLYNAQKVEAGRKKNNIYDLLKEEIDKSREAYERRFKQPQIQGRPYFRDALIQYLCDGNEATLGG